jgi:uncharacterized DUF497 family protein
MCLSLEQSMRISSIIWLKEIIDKLATKHNVEPGEVEQALNNRAKFYFIEKGERSGEDVYLALGQTNVGRYIAIIFIHKSDRGALILSARDMKGKERRRYGRK